MAYIVLLFVVLSIPAFGQRKTGNPLDHLPDKIELLTHFGERADISPDNQLIAFMDKSFGDAFVIDLNTRIIRCLTCTVSGAAFLRVMHLVSGDYLLIGPPGFSDIHTNRTRDNQLWFLSKKPGMKPQSLDQKMSRRGRLEEEAEDLLFRNSCPESCATARAVTIVRC